MVTFSRMMWQMRDSRVPKEDDGERAAHALISAPSMRALSFEAVCSNKAPVLSAGNRSV